MRILTVALSGLLLLAPSMAAEPASRPAAASEAIDWNRARDLHQRAQRGEKFSAEDQAYYERARAAFSQQQKQGQPARTPVASINLPPLTDSAGEYKGFSLGLYGDGQNTPPEAHVKAAASAAGEVVPRDRDGKPADDGKIVLMSLGMSNTTQEFSSFVRLANSDGRKGEHLVIVDSAQGGKAADSWSSRERMETWQEALRRLDRAGVTPGQVQVIWVKQARIAPAQLGGFPAHAEALEADLKGIVALAREQFPNLKLIYLSSRTYGGWATMNLNPEPFAYESAFAVQWLIRDQAAGRDPALAYDKAPVLLWGPYLWTDGTKGRSDGITWQQSDTAADGTHPSQTGQQKVARLLLDFFTTDASAKPWFTR